MGVKFFKLGSIEKIFLLNNQLARDTIICLEATSCSVDSIFLKIIIPEGKMRPQWWSNFYIYIKRVKSLNIFFLLTNWQESFMLYLVWKHPQIVKIQICLSHELRW